jgi:hypothetical protein
MDLFLRLAVDLLPGALQTRIAEWDAKSDARKFVMRPPSYAFIGVCLLFSALGVAGVIVGFVFLFETGQRGAAAVVIAGNLVAGGWLGALAVRSLYRRARRRGFYVFLHPYALVERTPRWVTVIPSRRLLQVFNIGVGRSHQPGVIYRDTDGAEKTYGLHAWYDTPSGLPDDLVDLIDHAYQLSVQAQGVGLTDRNASLDLRH